jgi:uncharacterized protein YjbI with pentapeptide repeats
MNQLRQLSTRRGRITLVLIAVGLMVMALVGIILVVSVARRYSLVAAGALITGWATLLSVGIAQLVGAWLATERARVDALQAAERAQVEALQAAERAQVEALQEYLKEMGALLSNNPGVRDRASADSDDLRTLARAHTLTVLSNLNPDRQELVNNYLREVQLLDALELYRPNATADIMGVYLEGMNNLLYEHNLRNSEPDSEVRIRARQYTLTVLSELDPMRKIEAMRFLIEAGLVQGIPNPNPVVNLPVVSLRVADLHGIALPGTNLLRADLASTNLAGANLSYAALSYAALRSAKLRGAKLRGAALSSAKLSDADLGDADLIYADLINADLSYANLGGANLGGANLRNANGVSEEELERQAVILKGATMPDGSEHP